MLAGVRGWREKTVHVPDISELAPGLLVVEGIALAEVLIAGLPVLLGKFVRLQRLDAERIVEVGTPGLYSFMQVVSRVNSGEALSIILLQKLVDIGSVGRARVGANLAETTWATA
jgi:hypothetical protein